MIRENNRQKGEIVLHPNHYESFKLRATRSPFLKLRAKGCMIKGSITRLTLYPQLKTYQTPKLETSC